MNSSRNSLMLLYNAWRFWPCVTVNPGYTIIFLSAFIKTVCSFHLSKQSSLSLHNHFLRGFLLYQNSVHFGNKRTQDSFWQTKLKCLYEQVQRVLQLTPSLPFDRCSRRRWRHASPNVPQSSSRRDTPLHSYKRASRLFRLRVCGHCCKCDVINKFYELVPFPF